MLFVFCLSLKIRIYSRRKEEWNSQPTRIGVLVISPAFALDRALGRPPEENTHKNAMFPLVAREKRYDFWLAREREQRTDRSPELGIASQEKAGRSKWDPESKAETDENSNFSNK